MDFEFYIAVLGVGSGPIGLVAPLTFKWLDSQPESSNMGLMWTVFYDFCDFQKSCGGFLTRYLSCFRPGCLRIHIFEVFGRNQKDARQKVTPIGGGINHLEKCLFQPFRVHFRFSIFGHFCRPISFACLESGSVVFTKLGHQP